MDDLSAELMNTDFGGDDVGGGLEEAAEALLAIKD
jgi:hypothetical protein